MSRSRKLNQTMCRLNGYRATIAEPFARLAAIISS